MLCEYGCGKEGIYFFKTVKKWCCSKRFSSCPAYKQRCSGKNNGMYGKESWVPH